MSINEKAESNIDLSTPARIKFIFSFTHGMDQYAKLTKADDSNDVE